MSDADVEGVGVQEWKPEIPDRHPSVLDPLCVLPVGFEEPTRAPPPRDACPEPTRSATKPAGEILMQHAVVPQLEGP
jgi:hypothetical protein